MKQTLKCKHLFDFTEYQLKLFDATNKKAIGKMKGVNKGKASREFVGKKSKMHCILSDDDKESNTVEGVNIVTAFNECKDMLFIKKVIRHKMKIIQSKKDKIGTYEVNKISLSCFDDKRSQILKILR